MDVEYKMTGRSPSRMLCQGYAGMIKLLDVEEKELSITNDCKYGYKVKLEGVKHDFLNMQIWHSG